MGEWIVSLEGTAAGERLALLLALQAAFLHAMFGALQKRVTDPWTARTCIDATYALLAAPFALILYPTAPAGLHIEAGRLSGRKYIGIALKGIAEAGIDLPDWDTESGMTRRGAQGGRSAAATFHVETGGVGKAMHVHRRWTSSANAASRRRRDRSSLPG